MSGEDCQPFFDIYVDKAKMLILIEDVSYDGDIFNPPRKEPKLIGRAILWEIDGKTYMDRVYVKDEYLENTFINYAQEQGWYYRCDQHLMDDSAEMWWYGPDNDYTETRFHKLYVKLDRTYEYYPYMDTFRYLNTRSNYITTACECGTEYLSNSDGSWSTPEPTYCDDCDYCEDYNEDGEYDDLVYSNYHSCYLCPDCRVWSQYVDDYIRHSVAIPVCTGTHPSDVEYTTDGCLDDIVEINGKFYDIDHPLVEYNEETDEYYLKDE